MLAERIPVPPTFTSSPTAASGRSDEADGPTAGTLAVDPPEFLARLPTHSPDPGQVMMRCYGCNASRTRRVRRRQAAGGAEAEEPLAIPPAGPLRH